MATKYFLVFLLLFCYEVQSASILEQGYEYFVNLGKNFAPNLLSILECVGQNEAWECAREKAGKMLDGFEDEVEKERRSWEEEADAEIRTSGRSIEEMPSKIGREITDSLSSLANIFERGMARALGKKHHEGGGIDSITISTGGDKKKMKKKKPKPPKIHLIHPVMMPLRKAPKEEKEQRGKKKKKKKAILKLLILGAVIKAKIGTLLQILTYKLQIKFFIVAVLGLAINLARLWIDLKNKHSQQPQKIIYYEHAQHQHHYDHEEEEHGWGPWSRSILPDEESEADASEVSPYKAQERNPLVYSRPYLTRV